MKGKIYIDYQAIFNTNIHNPIRQVTNHNNSQISFPNYLKKITTINKLSIEYRTINN